MKNSNKTKLQIEFEEKTPTIIENNIQGNEYNLIYCAYLETQVEKLRKTLSERQESTETSDNHNSKALHIADVSNLLIAYKRFLDEKGLLPIAIHNSIDEIFISNL